MTNPEINQSLESKLDPKTLVVVEQIKLGGLLPIDHQQLSQTDSERLFGEIPDPDDSLEVNYKNLVTRILHNLEQAYEEKPEGGLTDYIHRNFDESITRELIISVAFTDKKRLVLKMNEEDLIRAVENTLGWQKELARRLSSPVVNNSGRIVVAYDMPDKQNSLSQSQYDIVI